MGARPGLLVFTLASAIAMFGCGGVTTGSNNPPAPPPATPPAATPTVPTVTVTASAAAVNTLQSVSVTITLAGSGATPTGTVTLTSGTYDSGALNLSSGSAIIQIAAGALPAGTDTLTASYSPDSASSSAYKGSTGSSIVTVNKIVPAVTVTTSSASLSTLQSVSVMVSLAGSEAATPSGTVTLTSGAYTSGALNLASGSAIIQIAAGALPAGTDTLTASYSPDSASSSIYRGSTGSASVTVSKIVPGVSVTPPSEIPPAENAVVLIEVSGAIDGPEPTGSVVLTSGSYASTATALSNGRGAISIPAGALAVGQDPLRVVFTPDATSTPTYAPATGSASITVAKLNPKVTITPAATSVGSDEDLQVAVNVSAPAGDVLPTGSIVLSSGTYTSSTELSLGAASIVIPAGSLTPGTAVLSAAYKPDPAGGSNYNSASGASSAISVIAPGLWLNPIFSSNMVLQEGVPCPVFGTGDVGSTITVQFLGQTISTQVGADRKWRVNLSSMPANSASNTLTVSASDSPTITLTGVQVGEVWLFAGQSNMEFALINATNSAPYIADAGNHDIRFFTMYDSHGPSSAHWQVSKSTTAPWFSAVAYFTGLELSQSQGVPIGLIEAAHGGSPIAHWETTDGGSGIDYLAMVKAIQPFAIRGVGWYQGEDSGSDSSYQAELTDMIGEWRADWGNSALPFGIVQLPYTEWATSAVAQFKVSQTVPNTFLAVTHDLYTGTVGHPPDKRPVGIRLALGARATVYGENIEYSGPVPSPPPASYPNGSSAMLTFTHLGNGLSTSDGSEPGSFQVAGPDGQYSSAAATISGENVAVASDVTTPRFLSYGLVSGGNLVNLVNIPVEGGKDTITYLPAPMFQLSF